MDGKERPDAAPAREPGRRRLTVELVLLGIILLFALFRLLPVGERVMAVLEWTEGLGVWAPVLVALSYTVACIILWPGTLLTLGAGFLFGVVTGTITVSIGSTLGACTAFLLGRTVARRWVARRLADRPKFAAIDRAVEREGWKIVLLTRLSPIFPFTLLNYGFGLTSVRFSHYAVASWIGMLPMTVVFVYTGSASRSLAAIAAGQFEGGAAQKVLYATGLVVTVVVAVLVARIARGALKQAVEAEADDE